ncbi:ComF family protein [Leifsonia sp. NPDC058292]|uniref:ComF family protein n=1 Tax=Leifsonia sp. NPDC058292 TaxID=3346428 RepID=UPI0036DAA56D
MNTSRSRARVPDSSTIAWSVREAVLDAIAVLSPVTCSGCGAPDRALCRTCLTELTPRPTRIQDLASGPPVWAALDYSGVVRSVILAYKDHGRTDATRALAQALRAAVAAAVSGCDPRERAGGLVLVTIPSTRAAFRRRGYHPTAAALRRAGLAPARSMASLRLVRAVSDQAGLTAAGRADNRRGSFEAAPRLRGRACLIVDDIVTSGATVREAARAIEAVGGVVIGAAAIAHTELRRARRESLASTQGVQGGSGDIAGSQPTTTALR